MIRPQAEWLTRIDPTLSIVSDELWSRVQLRIARTTEGGNWARPKGKPKHLLSGLLRCASCGGHYVIANRHEYGCSAHRDGGACDNGIRVRRDVLEDAILGPVRRDLLSPERVRKTAEEMERYFRERMEAMQSRVAEVPKELQELGARIERLRERLRRGDPDMLPDEIEAAISKAEGTGAACIGNRSALDCAYNNKAGVRLGRGDAEASNRAGRDGRCRASGWRRRDRGWWRARVSDLRRMSVRSSGLLIPI